MSTNKILLKFAKKGINLSPEAYDKVINAENPVNFASNLIVKLKGDKFTSKDLVSVSGETVDEVLGIKKEIPDNSQKTLVEDKEEPAVKNQTSNIDKATQDERAKNVNEPHSSSVTQQKPTVEKTPEKPKIEKKSSVKTPEKPKDAVKPTSIENLKKESDTPETYVNEAIKEASETIKKTNIKFKRNQQKSNVEYDFKIIQDTSKKSYTSGEIENLIAYFKSRYEKLANILSKRPDLRNYTKINDIDDDMESLTLILMVREIRSSKNGHKIVEFEDDTGTISILFSKNNDELFREAEKLVRDEVVGVIANKSDDRNFAFGQQIINPGVLRVPDKEMDFGIVFLSDVHIGSLTFLEDAFQRFIDWINCEAGDEEQRRVAEDVKYLIIGGDIVDGIGVYPNQDKELAIKDITEQYNEAARFLGNIRSDIKIIIAPGNHDASRVAEPQPAVPEEYAKALYELDNVEFISNPGVVSLDGINVLIYHGRSFDDMVMAVKEFEYEKSDAIMEELLLKRHLAPLYGERTPLASELEDYLVIDEVPDIFHTGHIHINSYRRFKGVHLINSGTFQTQTEFQKIYNINPTPAEVPVIHKGKYRHFKFL
ncbi:MAG: DNA-directed DNA polymerase II small subunit [Methanobrevibacter sp.]|nr:DNA-directed DNA polymerase II small subunit [Methanobrevibacter sp.]